MFYFDPMYFVFIAPAVILAIWAQARVRSAYSAAAKIATRSGMTGAQAAQRILECHGVHGVDIEVTGGMLSDHYDPRRKVLRLSREVYGGRSLAAVGIAAHEVGHALQDSHGYALLAMRNAIVPGAQLGSGLSFIFIVLGMLINLTGLVWVGIALFSLVVVFQVVNLPVEYDASRRARDELVRSGIVAAEEMKPIEKVLSAAALTYVAATLTAILTLAYYVMRFTGSRN